MTTDAYRRICEGTNQLTQERNSMCSETLTEWWCRSSFGYETVSLQCRLEVVGGNRSTKHCFPYYHSSQSTSLLARASASCYISPTLVIYRVAIQRHTPGCLLVEVNELHASLNLTLWVFSR